MLHKLQEMLRVERETREREREEWYKSHHYVRGASFRTGDRRKDEIAIEEIIEDITERIQAQGVMHFRCGPVTFMRLRRQIWRHGMPDGWYITQVNEYDLTFTIMDTFGY